MRVQNSMIELESIRIALRVLSASQDELERMQCCPTLSMKDFERLVSEEDELFLRVRESKASELTAPACETASAPEPTTSIQSKL